MEIKEHLILSCVISLLVGAGISSGQTISVSSELKRMRSSDHLFVSQDHNLLQYSGFHREGGNPDRMYCLYEEDGWRVIADHQGPGVVSRIWTTHHEGWSDIKIEVDGETIFEGKPDVFFHQDVLPFISPLSEVRNNITGRVTAEKDVPGRKEWAVSYVPIPFEKRFRYMQRNKVYANINIKAFPPGTKIQSFLKANWHALKDEFEQTAEVWRRMDLYSDALSGYTCIAKTVSLPATQGAVESVAKVEEVTGPAIVRCIRVKTKETQSYADLELRIYWDDQAAPGVISPLDYGFGSREHRTLVFGQTDNGWRLCCLPMPFRQKAKIELASKSNDTVNCQIEAFIEENVTLPEDVLYLYNDKNEGQFPKGGEFDKPDLPLKDFFYHNGYTAFEHQGSGHIVAYMDLFHCQPELDEHIFIDDERTFPDNSWNGTGHEDLFDMAWGHSPVSAPMTSGGSQDFEEVNVKLFWNDPMTFRTAIRFNWEWAFRFGVKAPRDARFASVVYWYGKP